MSTIKKTSIITLMLLEQVLRSIIRRITKLHERVTRSLLDLVFYRGNPGDVTFGSVNPDKDRIDGYLCFRDYDRRHVRIPFQVQNLPGDDLWEIKYVRRIMTQALHFGFNVMWIERCGHVISPTAGTWIKKDSSFDRIKSLFA